jgi:hypothetical protein
MRVFLPGSLASPQVSFRFVFVQNLLNFLSQLLIYTGQPLGYILVHGALADSKYIGSLPHSIGGLNYMLSYAHRSFANIVLHAPPPLLN